MVERVDLLSDRYYRCLGLSMITDVPRGHWAWRDMTVGRFPRTAGGLCRVRKLGALWGSYSEHCDVGNCKP
jgi:hypothetical protein